MFGEDDEAGEAQTGISSDERGTKWFGDLRGVDTRGVEVGEPLGTGAPSHRDVVLVGELLEVGDAAAELGGDVGQAAPPSDVFAVQPDRVERDGIRPRKSPGPCLLYTSRCV